MKLIKNAAGNMKSRKLVVWAAVTGVLLSVPADPNNQVMALAICGAAYLAGQGYADAHSK
jgi:hypothetical protein